MAKNYSDFRMLLHRYQRGQCSPAEKQRIEEWYRGLGSDQEFKLTADEKDELVATVWQRISTQTQAGATRGRFARAPLRAPAPTSWLRPATRSMRWAAAAVLTLGLGLAGSQWGRRPRKWTASWLPQTATPAPAPQWQVYSNASGYEVRVALPDGSAVTLLPASTLKYRREAGGPRRIAYLTGAALFDVFHDANHPFSVFTDQVVTTVLGTSFRVRAYAGQPEVQVQVRTGAVRVSRRAGGAVLSTSSMVVLPNQQAVYSPVRQQLRRELVAQPALLAPQSFVFNDRPVAEVLAALEKAYGVSIVHDAPALRSCTLTLNLGNEPLFAKLDIICEVLGASYEKADGRILFRSPPCQVE